MKSLPPRAARRSNTKASHSWGVTPAGQNASYKAYPVPDASHQDTPANVPRLVFVSDFTRLNDSDIDDVDGNEDDFTCDGWIVDVSDIASDAVAALTIDELLALPKQRVQFTPRGASRLVCNFRPLKIEAKPNRWGHELGIDDAKFVSFCGGVQGAPKLPDSETSKPPDSYQTVAEFALYRFYEELFPDALALRTQLFSITYVDAPIQFRRTRGAKRPGCERDVRKQRVSARTRAQAMPGFTIETRSALTRRENAENPNERYTPIDADPIPDNKLRSIYEDEPLQGVTEFDEASSARFHLYRTLIGDFDYQVFGYGAEHCHNNYRFYDESGRIHSVPYDLNSTDLLWQTDSWSHQGKVADTLENASANNWDVQMRRRSVEQFPGAELWSDARWNEAAGRTLDRLCDQQATEAAMTSVVTGAPGYEAELTILFDALRARLELLRQERSSRNER